jgi:hypothetical protein
MTTHEQQDQCVVFRRRDVHVWFDCNFAVANRFGLAQTASGIAANLIRHPAKRDLRQPRARIVRQTFAWPLQRRCEPRFLHGIFSGGEVAKSTDHRTEHMRRQLAQ